jgi:hypothetical protein
VLELFILAIDVCGTNRFSLPVRIGRRLHTDHHLAPGFNESTSLHIFFTYCDLIFHLARMSVKYPALEAADATNESLFACAQCIF